MVYPGAGNDQYLFVTGLTVAHVPFLASMGSQPTTAGILRIVDEYVAVESTATIGA